jgi:ribosomal protein S27AE
MALSTNKADKYFIDIANRVEINRCPSCDVGMIIDTPTDRACPKCGYSDSSNVPLKVKLKFKLLQEVTRSNVRECVVVAEEPNGKISFTKPFIDIATASSYLERMQKICL